MLSGRLGDRNGPKSGLLRLSFPKSELLRVRLLSLNEAKTSARAGIWGGSVSGHRQCVSDFNSSSVIFMLRQNSG
jgi:hypothetical protein